MTAEITGKTRLFGIAADPIHHVKTPQVFNAFLRDQGIDGVLVPFHVLPDGLETFCEGLRKLENFGGFIVTVPHKTAIVAHCDEVTDEAARVGAVNCVRRDPDGRLVGTIIDGIGFVEGLKGAGIDPKGMRAYVAGAGGAASAMAFALAGAGVASLTIGNRTEAKAMDLARRIAAFYPDLTLSTDASAVADQDLVVNGTSVGMAEGDGAALDVTQLHAGQVVAEAIMQPPMTPLLIAAEAKGCRVHPGLPMLQSQMTLMGRHLRITE
jgi:shikimate dehydrogenase